MSLLVKMNLRYNWKCFFGFHKWIIDERPSKEGDFKEGWSPIYFYEKCESCDKRK